MYNPIILSSCLFGSVYLFSKSLECLNKSLLKNYKIPYKLIVINSFIVIMSGSIILYSFVYSFNLLQF